MNKFELYNEELDYGFYNDIFKKLCCKNNNVFKKDSKKKKTKFIKEKLVYLGHDNNYKVYANGFESDEVEEISKHKVFKDGKKFVNKEWLYDVHWYTDILNKNYSPERFILACECEWSKGKKPSQKNILTDIGYDFQKLLFCNAEERLFITRVSISSNLKTLEEYFLNSINIFKNLNKNSKFMILCYCLENNKIYTLKLIKK